MFQKQLEKSRIENSQSNGTLGGALNEMATLNINDTTVNNGDEHADGDRNSVASVEQTPKGKINNSINGETDDSSYSTVAGSLHKRVTRRNSMLIQTPTKSILKTDPSPVKSSMKKRRCTMFAPSIGSSIDEDEDDLENTKNGDKDTHDKNDRTINKTVAMEMCNEPTVDNEKNKSISKVRQLLNKELLKTPRDNGSNGTTVAGRLNLRRRTTYTPQVMEETKVQNSSITPVAAAVNSQRRKTINANANANTPAATTRTVFNTPELIETKSCDAILTPTNNGASK